MTVSKKDVNAWNTEYEHLKWGGLTETSWIQNRLKKDSFLLDAGSGEGRYLREFCFKFPCIGIDISKNALSRSAESITVIAEKKAITGKAGSGFSFPEHILSSTAELPFSDHVFDGILCLGVLQHLISKDREKAAAEFHRVLKSGGLVFFEAFGEEDMRCLGEPAVLENGKTEPRTFERQNGIIYHYFEENEVKELFEENGFQTIELKSIQKEKKYNGEIYIRHHYRAIFEI
ncbi:MAG: class I SAM-dependent methyltransferase [Methanosarcinales archaeon]|jgi:ubiquinone/menaquinone biosynthesis C-methylase UbiE|nr:class I SAM-dependent methyltransferase [Methanosarcinales archaeon]